jgi:ribonuclease P protein component
MRFRPAQHLRRPAEIRAVREQGRRFDCRAFTLWWRLRSAGPDVAAAPAPAAVSAARAAPGSAARVCVIASTAAVGHAVLRNRAKRRLREVYRQHQAEVPAGCDLLLIARSGAGTWEMPELERRFVEACRQVSGCARSGPS